MMTKYLLHGIYGKMTLYPCRLLDSDQSSSKQDQDEGNNEGAEECFCPLSVLSQQMSEGG